MKLYRFLPQKPWETIILIILIMLLSIAGAFWWRADNKYDPIDFTKIQPTIRQPPAFHLDDIITVQALFHNTDDENVTFNGKVYWELKKPPEAAINLDNSRIFQFEFNRVLNPGCTELSFDNQAPDEVRNITARLFSEGYDTVAWEINGSNKVIEPKVGDEQVFHTQEFKFYHNSDKLPKYKNAKKLTCESMEEEQRQAKKDSTKNNEVETPSSPMPQIANPQPATSNPQRTASPQATSNPQPTAPPPEPEDPCEVELLGICLVQ